MLCPLHEEKSPSFKIYPESERFPCFGCGKYGNVINLVMEKEGLTFVEAVKFIANRHGIPIEYEAENHVNRRVELILTK